MCILIHSFAGLWAAHGLLLWDEDELSELSYEGFACFKRRASAGTGMVCRG